MAGGPRTAAIVAVACGLLGAASGLASTPRALTNSGFELVSPVAPNARAFPYQEGANDPNPRPGDMRMAAWSTTSPPSGFADRPFETWGTGFNGIPAPSGSGQFIEMNVDAPDRIFQTVCLTNGDDVRWGFFHRGRSETDSLIVGAFAAGSLTPSFDDPAVLIQKFTSASTAKGAWKHYEGASTFVGPTGSYEIGWEGAPKTANAGAGNLLDDASAELSPLVEIGSETPGAIPSDDSTLPLHLQIAGRLTATGRMTVGLHGAGLDRAAITVADPQGIPGAHAEIDDHGVVTVTVPPGIYGPPSARGALTVPIRLAGSSARHVRLVLAATGGGDSELPLRIGPAQSCSGAGTSTLTVTLSPQPADRAITANSDAVRDGAYTASYAIEDLGPNTASDVSATLGIPAGVTFATAEPSLGTCARHEDRVVCHFGRLGPQDAVAVTITGSVTSDAELLHSTAHVGSVTPDDPNLDNNVVLLRTAIADDVPPAPTTPAGPTTPSKTESTPAPPPPPSPTAGADTDLDVDVDAPPVIDELEPLDYSITVTNDGPQTAPNTRVIFTTPRAPGVQITAPRGTACRVARVTTCRLGELAVHAKKRIRVTARPTDLRTYALLADALTDGRDRRPRNNVATARTRVGPANVPCGSRRAASARAHIAC